MIDCKNKSNNFGTFLSSLSSCGVLVPLELLPLLLEFGVWSNPSGVRLRGEGGDGSLDSEDEEENFNNFVRSNTDSVAAKGDIGSAYYRQEGKR